MQQNKSLTKFLLCLTQLLLVCSCGQEYNNSREKKTESKNIEVKPLSPLNLSAAQNVSLIDQDGVYSEIAKNHTHEFLLLFFFDRQETKALRDSIDLYSRGTPKCQALVLGERTQLRDYDGVNFSVKTFATNMNALALTRRFTKKLESAPRFLAINRNGQIMAIDSSEYPKRILPICLR